MTSATRQPSIKSVEIGSRQLRVVHWRARESGADSIPLLFFSGIGGNAELLAPFMEALRDREVITFDMPGIGGSAADGGPYLPADMARVAEEIVTAAGHARVDVMGVSWGGMIAEQFALQYPDRVQHLVLAATSAGLLMVPGKLGALALMLNPRKFVDRGFIHRHFDRLFGGGKNGWEKYSRGIRPPTPAGYAYQLLALFGWTGAAFLHRIKAPTLILAGTDDRLVRSANAYILKLLLPDAEVRFVEGAGHMLLLSHVQECADAVELFLDQSAA
jgi:poly(3-hydroxyalkanoate) depolymerase